MRREIFNEEHTLFREQFRRFVEKEIEPNLPAWNHAGIVPRSIWKSMGQLGYLGISQNPKWGGAGADFLFEAIVMEEMLRVRASGPQVWLHSSICIPYLESYGTDVQKRKYLTAAIAGDCVLALGMTEPGAGSDLANIRTRAEISGGHYVVNGSKIFISNGQSCDLVILAVKTDRDKGHKGVSLLLVETDTPGFQHGRNLEKIGLKAQDTSELFFEDCRVPVENLLWRRG